MATYTGSYQAYIDNANDEQGSINIEAKDLQEALSKFDIFLNAKFSKQLNEGTITVSRDCRLVI